LIKRLDNQNPKTAKSIDQVFKASYAVEVKILNAEEIFPPLKRTLNEYRLTDTEFFGYWHGSELAAVIEIRTNAKQTLIQSLVVEPHFFRQGKASQLIKFVLENFKKKLLFVETGRDNKPAIQLYEKFGFKITKQWLTECGIVKVRLELSF